MTIHCTKMRGLRLLAGR